jgi:hypothetical protein
VSPHLLLLHRSLLFITFVILPSFSSFLLMQFLDMDTPISLTRASLPLHLQTPTPLTSLAAIDGLETAELVEYCKRYYPDRVYTGVSGGLGADGEDERGRERERAQRIRDVRVAVGWVGGGAGDGAAAGDGGGDRDCAGGRDGDGDGAGDGDRDCAGDGEEEGAGASASGNGNGNRQAAEEEDPETSPKCDVPYSDPAYAALEVNRTVMKWMILRRPWSSLGFGLGL